MAKNAVSDWDPTTATSNSDIAGTDISGATGLVKNGDNAIREMMRQIKSGVQTGYTTTATAAGTTTLTANSNSYQYFTGTTTQIIVMPVTSTLEFGRTWTIVNASTGVLTVNSSGGNLIVTIPAGSTIALQCILLTGTTAASWSVLAYSNPGATVGADIATAGTLDLTAAAPFFNLTGTTTVTAVTLGTNLVKQARTVSAFKLTQSASLIVNGSSVALDFTVPAGALLEFVGYASSVVRVFVTNAFPNGSTSLPSMPFGTSPSGGSGFSYSQALDAIGASISGAQVSNWNSLGFGVTGILTASGVLTVNGTSTSTIAGPLNIAGASAGQLVFPASQNASANANTLDDYEEGTFTPTMTFNASSTGVTYGAQVGQYIKIGQLVFIWGRITLTSNGTGVGNALITGLPFTSLSASANMPGGNLKLLAGGSAATGLRPVVVTNTTTAQLVIPGAVSDAVATDTNLTDTFSADFALCYQAAA